MKSNKQKSVPGRLFYTRSFALGSLLILGYLIYLIVTPFLSSLAWAFIIAFLLYPLYTSLLGWMNGRTNSAALLLTVLTLLFLLGPLSVLAAAFATQAADLLREVQQLKNGAANSILDRLIGTVLHSPLSAWFQTAFDISPADMERWINESASNALRFLVSVSGDFFLGALSTVTAFSITIFILFFFLRDGTTLISLCRDLIPLSDERKENLTRHLSDVMRAVVFGTVFTAMIQGTLTGAALAVLNIPAPVVLGAIAALFALLPVGGTTFVWGPVCLILILDDRWFAAIGLALWGTLLVGTIDNFLRPLLVSSRSHVGTLTVFIGVFGGALAFGMVGLLLGPVILALGTALIRFAREQRLSPDSDTDD